MLSIEIDSLEVFFIFEKILNYTYLDYPILLCFLTQTYNIYFQKYFIYYVFKYTYLKPITIALYLSKNVTLLKRKISLLLNSGEFLKNET